MDSYGSKNALTGRQLRELRKTGLSSPHTREPWSVRNEALISPSFRQADVDHDGKISKTELNGLLKTLNVQFSDRKVREITDELADGHDTVDVAFLAGKLADDPDKSRYLAPGMRGVRYGSGETIFHTADPSDFAVPKAAGKSNRLERWNDHGDIFAWGAGFHERTASPTPRSAPAHRRTSRGAHSWATTASEISATVGGSRAAFGSTATAGTATGTLWKERNQMDFDRQRWRHAPKPSTPAQATRRPTWSDQHGVMPRACSAPAKVFRPRERPPPPPPPVFE